jgi:hypothetical protein
VVLAQIRASLLAGELDLAIGPEDDGTTEDNGVG